MTVEKNNFIHDLGHSPLAWRTGEWDQVSLLNLAEGFAGSKGELPITRQDLEQVKAKLSREFIYVAPDLSSHGLAEDHVRSLINHLINVDGVETRKELLMAGAKEFYTVAKDVLGPVWVDYLNTVLMSAKGNETFLFAARDATPFYYCAMGIVDNAENKYNLENSRFVHVDWNRWFMGQEDELDDSGIPLNIANNPLLHRFYLQMGFGNGGKVKIVEPGAWGSAANAIKTMMPNQDFELWFLFSHMPDRIYGHLNTKAPSINPKLFEVINDTGEALPKSYIRPDKLTTIEENGVSRVVADLNGKSLNSRLMKLWTWAVNQGAYDAGARFAKTGENINFLDQVRKIESLREQSMQGEWTGILPQNTLTWTEGENWVRNWKWGQIPPLK